MQLVSRGGAAMYLTFLSIILLVTFCNGLFRVLQNFRFVHLLKVALNRSLGQRELKMLAWRHPMLLLTDWLYNKLYESNYFASSESVSSAACSVSILFSRNTILFSICFRSFPALSPLTFNFASTATTTVKRHTTFAVKSGRITVRLTSEVKYAVNGTAILVHRKWNRRYAARNNTEKNNNF